MNLKFLITFKTHDKISKFSIKNQSKLNESHGSFTGLKLVLKKSQIKSKFHELDIEKINLKLSGGSGMWTS